MGEVIHLGFDSRESEQRQRELDEARAHAEKSPDLVNAAPAMRALLRAVQAFSLEHRAEHWPEIDHLLDWLDKRDPPDTL